jgi:hypothetical protein
MTGEEKRSEEKKRNEKRREERRTSNCEILAAKSLRYFRMLHAQQNRGYTEPNITHAENHKEFKFVMGETADIWQYYTTTQT